ncbi:MAG TPA: cytochrome b [Stellaceae bacterium]|nr:cytochrome b [Stellaceae bacterium]
MSSTSPRPETGYDAVHKLFHWLVFVLVAVQFTIGWRMPEIHRDTKPDGAIAWHLAVGATILAVAALRLAWRLYRPVPLLRDGVPPWEQRIAAWTHGLLYVLLFAMLLLGWANASARGYPAPVLGLIPLPGIAPEGSRLGMRAGDLHALLSWALLGLIGLHVAAALYHRFIRRDRVMQRMLPGA